MEPSRDDWERIRRLQAMLKSPNKHEADNARRMLEAMLAKFKLTLSDLDVLGRVEKLIAKYISLTREQRLAVALWILHTYVFDHYNLTPRLALLSPVFGCGKTTLLTLIEHVAFSPVRFTNVSAALIFRILGSADEMLLLDEGNHLGLLTDRTMRSILNSNRRGDQVGRAAGRGVAFYDTYKPVAIAAKGQSLPNDLIQRSVVIHMQKPPPETDLERLNEADPKFLEVATTLRDAIQEWVNTCRLNPNPVIPLKWRAGDNWRVLLAIADNLGRGEEARQAALMLSSGLPDEDPALLLLIDIRTIFDTLSVDRIASAELLERLHSLPDGLWLEWRGPNDDQLPHKLSASEMARILGGNRLGGGFGIRPHTVWSRGGRMTRGASAKGYYKKDFEAAWAAYCPGGTPAHRHTGIIGRQDTESEAE